MSIDRFQGDPKLTLDENGADMVFKGGQPEMDRGLENAAMISLFTKKGWWGNVLFEDINQQIGSDFLDKVNQPISLSSLNDSSNAAIKAFNWMLNTKLASNIKAKILNPESNKLQLIIFIEPPKKLFVIEKNGLNWQSQKIDPAYLRVN